VDDGNNFSWGAKDAIKMFDGKVQVAGGPRYDWFSSRTDNDLNGRRRQDQRRPTLGRTITAPF